MSVVTDPEHDEPRLQSLRTVVQEGTEVALERCGGTSGGIVPGHQVERCRDVIDERSASHPGVAVPMVDGNVSLVGHPRVNLVPWHGLGDETAVGRGGGAATGETHVPSPACC